jgi:membrane protease YdiL (CAAX protease family)
MKEKSIGFKRLFIFLLIAVTVSNLFRFDVFSIRPQLEAMPAWLYIFFAALLEGSGVLAGALVAICLLKRKRTIEMSFWGTSKKKVLVMAVIPVVLLTIIGVANNYELNVNLYGLMAVVASLLYCIMEEFGWRGYLQEELKFIQPWKRYLTIGTIWYCWHLSFLTDISVSENLIFWAMMIVASWGIGQVAIATKSILACACFHLIIQLMMFNSFIKNGLNGTQKLIILGVSVMIWIMILQRGKNKSEKN